MVVVFCGVLWCFVLVGFVCSFEESWRKHTSSLKVWLVCVVPVSCAFPKWIRG